MRKPVQLHIPQPCHEDWNKMAPVDKGKFCGSCQKQVVDFTKMNDEQVVAFFRKESTGSVCGRFMQDQLNRSIEIPKKRIPWVKYFFQFALPAFLLSNKIAAQGEVRAVKVEAVPEPIVVGDVNETGRTVAREKKQEKIIRGKIIDQATDRGIAYAPVFIKGSTIGVASDSMGCFALKYTGVNDFCLLTCAPVGFEETQILVDINHLRKPVILSMSSIGIIERDIEIVFGIVAKGTDAPFPIVSDVDTIVVPMADTSNFLDTIRRKILTPFRMPEIYPNPLAGGQELTIEMKKQQRGAYLFLFSAISGQVIINKKMWIDENNRVVKLTVPPVAAGIYLLKITDTKSGKGNTEKIIIN